MTIILLFLLGCSFFSAFGVKLHYDSFEQVIGQDVCFCDIRVRKFNRTTAVLNGTIYLYNEFDNNLIFSLDVYYSRLGNQQYNHLPIKLPTSGLCDFMDNINKFYPEVVKYFINSPPAGECPVKRREIHVLDLEYPSHIIPTVFQRKGLWKTVVHGWQDGNEVIQYTTIAKATDD
ncbi:uncharacterized protein LOC128723874 [Anopheles nili]|uniref:uncharacterized protein LOC128723874 n=1 Tax=Anopheles nili TaxID=185578 RepID=UPI00237A0C9C|nr:uncharacterized protein LOC128723874 [Anopheles nili]